MKLITRDTDYALRALCFIAGKPGEIVPIPAMVACIGIPKPFLRKILQILNKNRILRSSKGAGGGFSLEKRPADVCVTDIIEIFQGPLRFNECLFKKTACPNRARCVLRKRIQRIESHMVRELKKITLQNLLKN